MKKLLFLFSFISVIIFASAQALTVSGTVSGDGKMQDDVLIDIYEYNSPIVTLHTDPKGYFNLNIVKGKEYVLVFYKSGYVLQSISISDSRENKMSNHSIKVDLARDDASPEGLYFKPPVRRLVPESTMSYFTDAKFDLQRIKPRHRADSVMVLLDRAQANQYILVNNIKLNSNRIDDKYSRQIEDGIKREIKSYEDKLKNNLRAYDSLYASEEKNVRDTKQTSNDEQLAHITEAQRLLSARLGATTEHYQLEQLQQLAEARLSEINALRQQQDLANAKDSLQKKMIQDAYWQTKSLAVNHRYHAMDANRKMQVYNRYEVLNYQEYIELLRYKERKDDTAHVPAKTATTSKPQQKPATVMTAVDTTDNLSKASDSERSKLIQQALEEEARFKNYAEKTETRKVNGAEMKVTDIHIADDDYEMQIDKKGGTRYFKNNKPVTKLTFEFETRRRMTDVLKTIREVEKFGK